MQLCNGSGKRTAKNTITDITQVANLILQQTGYKREEKISF
jgi:hypothetical protein